MTRRRRKKRSLRWLRSPRIPAVLLALLALGTAAWDTWHCHRLDSLTQRHVQLEQERENLRLAREAAELRWTHATARDAIVDRAIRELAFVESTPQSRQLLARPSTVDVDDREFGERLADRLDRFAAIRAAIAGEKLP